MSKDIRSFFTKAPKQGSVESSESTNKISKKKILVLSSDDEVIPDTPPIKEQKLVKKRRIISDSDDESGTKTKKVKPDSISSKSKNRTPARASDIFGSEPVKRIEKSVEKEKLRPSDFEAGVHMDDDFNRTLKDLDEELEKVHPDPASSKSSKNSARVSQISGSELVKSTKKSVKKEKLRPSDLEVEVHMDDDFNKTLMDLDEESFVLNSPQIVSKAKGKKGKGDTENNKKKSDKNDTTTPIKKEKSTPIKDEKNVPIKREQKTPVQSARMEKKTPVQKFSQEVDDEPQESGMDPDEERYEKRRQSAALYQKFLKRSGPKNPGSKEIPQGKPGCLSGLVFVITGVLESLERDEAAQIITELGGRVPAQISGKVTHVVLGEDAGPAKLAKAQSMNINIISEDGLLDLIREKSGLPIKRTEKRSINDESSTTESKKIKIEKKSPKDNTNINSKGKMDTTPKKKEQDHHQAKSSNKVPDKLKDSKIENKNRDITSKKTESKDSSGSSRDSTPKKNYSKDKRNSMGRISSPKIPEMKKEKIAKHIYMKDEKHINIPRTTDQHYENIHSMDNLAWVDKHKPTSCKQIIGQQGPSSNCSKLLSWLSKWHVNHNGKTKLVKPSPWAKNDDGAYFKAALLSGPPGVGKTTTATLVCKELEFDTVEFNASDTRSKKLLKDQISELLSNKSLHGYFKGSNDAISKKHVLIMDEVDGMAGNEDRGGLQELINLIKASSVPIICMCNDRNHQKMRTLVNYCYDLRFNKPRLDQVKGAMMSVCFKEGVKISPDALTEIISGANQDIRQILNHLSMWSADNKNINLKTATKEAQSAKKDIKIGPWEVVRKVFSEEEHKTMTMQDKSDLFFHDYSLSPLFVQQNYLIVQPHGPKEEVLKKIALTADSLSLGDLVDKRIRSSMAWSLLPTQAMFSSVLPGEYMCGHVAGQINFPGWLGKNSKRNKLLRMSSEVYSHLKSKTTASKRAILLDYAKPLLDAITRPLINEGISGVSDSLAVLKDYQLLREDIENLQELNNWPGKKDPMTSVEGKVKAALTRTFNKELAPYSYSITSVSKKKATTNEVDEMALLENEDEATQESEDEKDNDNIENDTLIKAKKKTAAKASATTSKAGARGKGKGKAK